MLWMVKMYGRKPVSIKLLTYDEHDLGMVYLDILDSIQNPNVPFDPEARADNGGRAYDIFVDWICHLLEQTFSIVDIGNRSTHTSKDMMNYLDNVGRDMYSPGLMRAASNVGLFKQYSEFSIIGLSFNVFVVREYAPAMGSDEK